MVVQEEAPSFSEILSGEDVALEQFHELRRVVHSHIDQRAEVERLLQDFSKIAGKLSSENKAETRKAVTHWILGQVEQAVPILEQVRATKERAYFLGLCYMDLGRHHRAMDPLKEAHEADASDPQIRLALLEAKIQCGLYEEAERFLDNLGKKYVEMPDVHYLKGLLYDVQGYYSEAQQAYEKALELEPAHARSLFRVAGMLDRRGENAKAVELYEQLRKLRPVHVNTMLNLGIIYEDRGEYQRAVDCYKAVLDYYPNHRRAKRYLKDAQASLSMFYDEEAARREQKLRQLLIQAVADIPFSPRIRGALTKMGVVVLGDLVRRTEEDLLSVPNFGKTSLEELKEFLSSKGLSLASSSGGGEEVAAVPEALSEAGTVSDDAASKLVSEIEWSTRVRNVMDKLDVKTLGDLAAKNERDLLDVRNLGASSIKEIQKKLAEFGLSLQRE